MRLNQAVLLPGLLHETVHTNPKRSDMEPYGTLETRPSHGSQSEPSADADDKVPEVPDHPHRPGPKPVVPREGSREDSRLRRVWLVANATGPGRMLHIGM